MKKNLLTLILLKALIIIVMTACEPATADKDVGIAEKKPSAEDVFSISTDPTTLAIYVPNIPVNAKEISEQIAARTKTTINVRVEFKSIDGYHTDSISKMVNSNQCDIICMYGQLDPYIERGLFLDITDYFPMAAPDLYSKFSELDLYGVTYNDKIYAIPSLMPASRRLCAVVRKDLIDKYDVENIENLDDLKRFVRLIRNNEPGIEYTGDHISFISKYMSLYGYAEIAPYIVYKIGDPGFKLMP